MDETTRRRRAGLIVLIVMAAGCWWTWAAGMSWLLIPAAIAAIVLVGPLFFRTPGGTR